MLEELQISWNSYHSQVEPELKKRPDMLLGFFETLLSEVYLRRVQMEKNTSHIGPELSAKSRKLVTKAVVVYFKLCVLEDKVERVIRIGRRSGDLSEVQLIDELKNVRQ
ncbi:hypothetical protein PsorP6_012845 [Peronosclerospora sorghi]|uniref:Uncharacterized protein n=1 Tax=Peronosclerospora sorghi TaxID=230839 RepID=A0ACC0WGA7_9STRA|nr:hypothetical protein PsorP6_012845 [Peronosclerospora sorghi]